MAKTIKILKTIVISLTVLGIGLGGFIYYNYSDLLRNPSKAFNNKDSGFEYVDADGKTHLYNEGIISFMIYGLDSDTARQKRSEGWRTDVMMACVVDTEKNKASLVSVPRDTRAQVQMLNSEGKPTKTTTTKLNGAFAYGGGPDKFGYENSLNAVNKALKVDKIQFEPIEYYVGMDLDGFVAIADTVGGVTVTLPENVPNVGKTGETVTVKGDSARQFIQYRGGGGDLTRTTRQREYMKECAKKLKNDNPTKNIPKLYKEFTEKGYLKTNMDTNQITALAYSLLKIDLDEINFDMVPGNAQTINGASYFIIDEDEWADKIKQLFYFIEDPNNKNKNKKKTTFATEQSTAKFTTKKTTAKQTSAATSTTGKTTTSAATTTKQTTAAPTTTTTKQTTAATTTAATTAANP